ncbi:MAG: hypothetical protein KGI93_07065, partial [Acidobacteriota bacterium]|nr:hypothetical protein [Acidobacteriota bacterium]
ALWLALGLANAPTLALPGPFPRGTPTPTTVVNVTGTGDAGDTITLYDGATVIGTTVVGADGTWTIPVLLGAGSHTLTATQTVNALPHAGLTSAASSPVTVVVYPDAPAITGVTTPGVATPTSAVTVSGTGAAGDTITLYDGNRVIGTATVAGDGTWSLTVLLGGGTHSLTAVQTATGRLTSLASPATSVVVPTPPHK